MKRLIIVSVLGMVGFGMSGTIFTNIDAGPDHVSGITTFDGDNAYHSYVGNGGQYVGGHTVGIGSSSYTNLYGNGGSYSITSNRVGNTTYFNGYGSGGTGFHGSATTYGGATYRGASRR